MTRMLRKQRPGLLFYTLDVVDSATMRRLTVIDVDDSWTQGIRQIESVPDQIRCFMERGP